MRSLGLSLCALLLASCDLQPPPKAKAQAPSAVADVATPPKQPGNVGKPVTAAECLAVGEHFAQVLIDTATDPAERAILEQEKTRNVRRQGETCETNQWDEATRTCFLRATTRPALQACITAAAPPAGSAAAPPAVGSGSAAEPPPRPPAGSAAPVR